MEITLRNGEKIKLDWNLIILEYLEEYEGGLEQLKKDVKSENSKFRAFNYVLYCMISSSYPEEIGYREAVSLIDINDLEKITNFIYEKVNSLKKNTSNKKDSGNKLQRSHRR